MPTNIPLHKTEDWTISGDTLTFLVAPQDNKRVVAHYSYLDATAPGASNGHTHIREQKDSWPNPTTTWQLTHTPEIATTPTVGQMLVFAEDQGGNFLWVAYRNQPSTDLAIRNMELNPDGTFLQWACPEIIGFDDAAAEMVTAICAHPTDPHIVYVATISSDSHIRIYRSADWATITKVKDITSSSSTAQVVRIYVEQTTTYVWFALGQRSLNANQGPIDLTNEGVWLATDGITFIKKGGLTDGLFINDLAVKEAAPRKLWIYYHGDFFDGPPPLETRADNGVAISIDDGVTWVKHVIIGLNPPYYPLPYHGALIAYPPLTGETNLRVSYHESPVSLQQIRSWKSVDGGVTWVHQGLTSGPEDTDGAWFYHDPLILLRLGTAQHGLAGSSVRSVDGGVTYVATGPDDRAGIQGVFYRQITTHWTLPWAVIGSHTGPVPGTGPWNDIYITTDAGATTPWARLTEAAGFNTANLLIHGVAFVQNNSKF